VAEEKLVTDPVCGMKIKPEDAVATIEHDGTTYYFCSQDCADAFAEAPEDYL
jgi:YHS domain-containing protein